MQQNAHLSNTLKAFTREGQKKARGARGAYLYKGLGAIGRQGSWLAGLLAGWLSGWLAGSLARWIASWLAARRRSCWLAGPKDLFKAFKRPRKGL